MKATLKIRRARDEDAPVLTDLILRSKASNGYGAAFMAACADELAMTPSKITGQHVWVAETDAPKGCVCLSIKGAHAKVETFFIDPDAKRQGIGRALWQTVLDTAHAKEITRLTLDSDPAAVPFYEAMGFRTIGQTPSSSIAGRTLPLMELRIPHT